MTHSSVFLLAVYKGGSWDTVKGVCFFRPLLYGALDYYS
jgi:hypothetical protein